MNKTCKVKPDYNTCMMCTDIQIESGEVCKCDECPLVKDTYELISVGTSFVTGDYAMVLKNGVITRVPLKRVFDVLDKESLVETMSTNCRVPL